MRAKRSALMRTLILGSSLLGRGQTVFLNEFSIFVKFSEHFFIF